MRVVGLVGAGVRAAVVKYLGRGCEVNLRIYREARHELLFELNRREVMEDMMRFMISQISLTFFGKCDTINR